ncbi:hypothetical protein GF337_13770 [candidate division KSB1 bacterium]|nr:hypothetical protein [candidate division KSB1 bacterium]
MTNKLIIMLFIIILVMAVSIWAQDQNFLDEHATMKGLNCQACHDCLNPSLQDPCLKLGPHFFLEEGIKLSQEDLPPEVVVIDQLEEHYGPVKFKHRKHMHMAERIEDCAECHHYIPPDYPKRKCDTCHNPDVFRDKLETISLNGVYHRKCLGCHVEWSKTTNCEICHEAKIKEHSEKLAKLIPTIIEAKRPDKLFFVTSMFTGPYVTFSHTKHSNHKKLKCADCHVKQPCIACHYQNEKVAEISPLARHGVHGTCRQCHDVFAKEQCGTCHKETQEKEKMAVK